MNVAIIPARGGSKRILRKNIREFADRPMIAWSIDAALGCGCFERVIVSTDDDEIAHVARGYGAETPFKRPARLSDDKIGTVEVMAHATNWLYENENNLEAVCCIYATAPFISQEDIRAGQQALHNHGVDYAFSLTSFPFPVQRALKMDNQHRVRPLYPEFAETRSQDLCEAWHDAGQFYWGQAEAWRANKPIFSSHSVGVRLSRHRVQDIDTPEDWLRAEWLFRAMEAGNSQ